jgi:hypothetical protein
MRHVAIASAIIVISASLGTSTVHAQSSSPKPKSPGEIAAVSKLLAEKNEVCRREARKLKLHFFKRRRFINSPTMCWTANVNERAQPSADAVRPARAGGTPRRFFAGPNGARGLDTRLCLWTHLLMLSGRDTS